MRTASPLVAAYLADLDRRLAGADPAERADIVDSIREHVDAAVEELGHEPTPEDVQQILSDLGPVDDVAAAWSPETAPTAAPARRSVTDSPLGVALVALGGLVLGLLLVPVSVVAWLVAPAALALAVASGILWRRGGPHGAAWRSTFVATVPVAVVTCLVMGAATMFLSVVSDEVAPEPVVSVPATP
ncbi:hypothetical protein [Cellulomonas sp. Root137]|uniref:HAAS signaling domain-containing protein n=1 Tax=Cellulomonas sp. Root137 TaxID=1736459 RepID=UPI0006F84156|nr:hypothetical protein [Cellulomonas sp. Root137]KQY42934.1 hypothetical protein ASD18_18330 [Cellulomonas sp. Root137]KRD42967.1 hypothetical protein ASE38_01350 [Cellulomonas sp. Root930]